LIAGHVNAFGSGAITVGSGTTLNFSNFNVGNSVINNGGSILGTGTLNNVDAEAGTTTIGGANSTITQIGGTATVNVNAVNATVAAMSAGTLNINAAGAVVTNLSGGNIAVSNGLSVALRSGSSSGVISGAGGVAKQGSGTLTLAGNNTYSGATAVEAGKLVVNGAITNSTVTVQSGATLGGSGAVGSTTLLSGSAIAPGNSPGSITNIGNLTWSGGSSYQWEIFNASGTPGTDWDLIEVTGQLFFANISSTNRFSIDIFSLSGLPATAGPLAGWNPLTNANWTILSAAGGISGFDANNFTLNLANFTHNNSLFAAGENPGPEPIPEPGTWVAAALLGLAALYARRRRAQPSACSSQ
jgi:MYXO-CTERM domain-containing protein